ncbi:ATP-binding protein [Thiomicrorhabdus cannonii]|uniref:ATP-binding protein n=1 Tax=Thiomicrorhabdus cannonii TaxID=2748011 RepID=UPI001FE76FED|nr:ATP-binding protein [Thiomicrorhabdus cannonii]
MRIRHKLMLWLLLFGGLMLGLMLWSNHYVLHSTLLQYVDQRDQARLQRLQHNIEHYLQLSHTDSLNQVPQTVWLRLLNLSHRVDLTQTDIPLEFLVRPSRRTLTPDEFEERVSLLDVQGNLLYGPLQKPHSVTIPLTLQNQAIGQLSFNHRRQLSEQADIEFAQTQSKMLTWGALLVSLIGALLLWPLANHLLKPIQQLTHGLRQLALGHYSTRLSNDRRDEFGQLQHDFNHLAGTLEQSQNSRNQWIADVSHELRTPLTILRGSIEAMQDGVRPANERNLQALQEEVQHLGTLIEDLYQLSLSDVGGLQYRMERLDLSELLETELLTLQPRFSAKGLRLEWQLEAKEAELTGDANRLQQLIRNILLNSLSYTDAPGQVTLNLTATPNQLLIDLQDTPPGVSETACARLFERFYRTEASRNRRHGGSGLGLAIVQQIVQAHQGSITAKPSALGGLHLQISLPKAS